MSNKSSSNEDQMDYYYNLEKMITFHFPTSTTNCSSYKLLFPNTKFWLYRTVTRIIHWSSSNYIEYRTISSFLTFLKLQHIKKETGSRVSTAKNISESVSDRGNNSTIRKAYSNFCKTKTKISNNRIGTCHRRKFRMTYFIWFMSR